MLAKSVQPVFDLEELIMVYNIGSQSLDVENGFLRLAEAAEDDRTFIDPAMPAFNRPVLSIVVPTRNEVGNIDELVRRLEHLFGERQKCPVDDSSDQTPQAIEAVSARAQPPIV
jgi:hypothetical protein